MTQRDEVLATLTFKQAYTPSEIGVMLGIPNPSVRRALCGLRNEGLARSRGNGRWTLADLPRQGSGPVDPECRAWVLNYLQCCHPRVVKLEEIARGPYKDHVVLRGTLRELMDKGLVLTSQRPEDRDVYVASYGYEVARKLAREAAKSCK